jgi:hypothetical protein
MEGSGKPGCEYESGGISTVGSRNQAKPSEDCNTSVQLYLAETVLGGKN